VITFGYLILNRFPVIVGWSNGRANMKTLATSGLVTDMAAQTTEVTEIKGGLRIKVLATVEVRDSEKPALIAECLFRHRAWAHSARRDGCRRIAERDAAAGAPTPSPRPSSGPA
jgi:hypothetical protein